MLVFVRGVLLEGGGEVVTEVRQDFRACLDEVDVVAVALFCLVAVRPVIGLLGGDAVVDETPLLLFEKVELPVDQL